VNFDNPDRQLRFSRQASIEFEKFLILRSIRNGGPSRTAQFNLRYDF